MQKLVANPNAFGIFGYSFLEPEHRQDPGPAIDGVTPDFEDIASGKYPISRPLYFYVKNAHATSIPGLREYVTEFTSEKAIGDDGYLADKGLIPAPKAERARFRADAAKPDAARPREALSARWASPRSRCLRGRARGGELLRCGRAARRSPRARRGAPGALHSLPGYYGWYAALWCGCRGWSCCSPGCCFFGGALERLTLASLSDGSARAAARAEIELLFNDVRNAALGQASMRADDRDVLARPSAGRRCDEAGLRLALAARARAGRRRRGATALRRVAPRLRRARDGRARASAIGLMLSLGARRS